MEIKSEPLDRTLGSRDLPNASAVLILGILSIPGCCCYGFLGLILAIIALVLFNKDHKLYKEAPQLYKESSYKNLEAGRICAIIGLVLGGLYVILIILEIFLSIAFFTLPTIMDF